MRTPHLARTGIAAALCGAFLLTTASPAAAQRVDPSTVAAVRSVTITPNDITDLIRRARAAGADTSALEAAQRGRAATLGAPLPDLRKTILVFALRHGGDLLSRIVATVDPAAADQILRYAHTIADLLEKSDEIAKELLTGLLTQLGVPAEIAPVIAGVLLAVIQG